MNAGKISLQLADWAGAAPHARPVREAVFVREQGIPLQLEWDEWDERSAHALAFAAGACVGTGRLLPDGHIGRMAVLREWRGMHVGRDLLLALVERARSAGHATVVLSAQTSAAGFYLRCGFSVEGPEYAEVGIPHVLMKKSLLGP